MIAVQFIVFKSGINCNMCTSLQFKLAYDNMHTQFLGYKKLDIVFMDSIMLVNYNTLLTVIYYFCT